MYRFGKHIAILLLLIAVPHFCAAQEMYSVRYVLLQGSKLWLEGSSTINTFSCETKSLTGIGRIVTEGRHAQRGSDIGGSTIEVSIPVMTLDCGNSYMNDDMHKAMKLSKFPFITYRLLNAKQITSDTALTFNTIGEIIIAGVVRRIEIPVKTESLSGGHFQLTGSKALSMVDFDITPPSALFGLIKAHEKLVVRFDLIVGPETVNRGELTRAGNTR